MEKAQVFAALVAVPPSDADANVLNGKFSLTTWKGTDPDD